MIVEEALKREVRWSMCRRLWGVLIWCVICCISVNRCGWFWYWASTYQNLIIEIQLCMWCSFQLWIIWGWVHLISMKWTTSLQNKLNLKTSVSYILCMVHANTYNFQQWMSRLPQRWWTQRNAIRNANCTTSESSKLWTHIALPGYAW